MAEWKDENDQTWIPWSDVAKLYRISKDELKVLVEQEKIRTKNFINPHDDKEFVAYSLVDCDEYIAVKSKKTILSDSWF